MSAASPDHHILPAGEAADETFLFRWMVERQNIFEFRKQGHPWPWTMDPILQQHRFCNVFREDDKVTVWFRENIRDKTSRNLHHEIFNTALFRWFNRPETARVLLNAGVYRVWNVDTCIAALAPLHTVCTAAYIINTPPGQPKKVSIPLMLDILHQRLYREQPMPDTLKGMWSWLQGQERLGPFTAYEIVTDLRHTVLDNAPDILTWANPGPGALRGLRRLGFRGSFEQAMYHLLQSPHAVAFEQQFVRKLEMREIEHSLCELDKYLRVRNNEGFMKNRYKRPL